MATLIKILPGGKEKLIEGGSMCDSIAWNEDHTFKEVAGHRPIIGCSLKVGSPFARSYSNQDWWLTTRVTEIVEETDRHIIFKTLNSTYKLIL